MRVVIAMMKHETNTFSPVPTPLARFARGQPLPFYGSEVYAAYKGTGSGVGAYIDLAEEAGAEIVTPIAANAWPSGPVEDAAFEHMTQKILEAVATEPDAILLDLHGAMVTESLEDGEGELMRRIREIAPEVPIAVALDMHTNLYSAIVDNATVIAGYQTYPHIDTYETGIRAGRPLFKLLAGEANPTMAWGNRPMLPHVMRQGTDDFPNKELQERTREMEAEGAHVATLFVGFPHADIREAGLSAVVVTDNDLGLAEKWRDELLDFAWREREAFVYQIEPLEDSLARAAEVTEGPVVLLDHYDNAASGGTMDTMTVLKGILDAGLDDVAAFAIHDPDAVQEMIAAGVGAEVMVSLGGKLDMPSIRRTGEPLEVTGRVKLISDGRYRNRGPASKGILMDMGPTVVLDTGKVEIVVISRHQEPNDLGCFLSLGIDPLEKTYLMLKSRIHYRAGFKPIAKQVIECAGVGVCTSDYSMLDFKNVRRPIYPLDLVNDP
ncbi:MAG: M81 family metallopeptidase [Alphaproteobacteria bacterium]|jgi:microcystin degradation protein MlrC|nr:M81 family metallopeptidase [Alphaproteobacteria bacterium]